MHHLRQFVLSCLLILLQNIGESTEFRTSGSLKDQATVDVSSVAFAPGSGHFHCPPRFTALATGCYYFSDYTANYWQAVETCVRVGGYLAVIEDQEDSDTLRDVVADTGVDHYFGAYDWGHEGTFVWEANRHPVLFTDFADGEPNNENGDENCLSFYSVKDFLWNDADCTSEYRFICEADFVPIRSD